MVISGGSTKPKRKPRNTIELSKPVYERLKAKQAKDGIEMKVYVNTSVIMSLEREEVLKRIAPHFSHKLGDDSVFIKDSRKPEAPSTEVGVQNGELVCFTHKSNALCEHIHYVLLLPEGARFAHKFKHLFGLSK